ncbi:MAG: cysteine--tRNA ligase [Phycisphaerae bacterium]
MSTETLTLYNTLTRSKDQFVPIEPGKVRLYTCGPTVYNYAHIGNLRTYVFEDVLKRVMIDCGYDVEHVMNVTDVGHLTDDADAGEDKMEKGARREGKSVWDIAQEYWDAFRADLKHLNIYEPTVWCRATQHIQEQIEQVRLLEEKGYTYTIEGDGVYFDTGKLDDYGKLARLDIEGLQAGARIEMSAQKRNPTDFALWKFSPSDKKRAMEWDSPWGVGFPGWHIECSAMAIRYLGERLDIHCGGIDHVMVHHTNEIAQAECALGHKWCNWWVHGEFLTMGEAGKMAKSDGEFLTLQSLIDRGYDPVAYRLFLLGAHYRQQLAFSWESLDASASAMNRLKREVLELRAHHDEGDEPIESYMVDFNRATRDDLNMPRALATMWGVLKDSAESKGRLYATLVRMDRVLGLGIAEMQETELDLTEEQIRRLLDERTEARANRDFARADAIRDELDDKGIEIMDSPEGTTWRRK